MNKDRGNSDIKTIYDELDRVKMVAYPDGRTLKMFYNPNGLLEESVLTSSVTQELSCKNYTYDENGNLTTSQHTYDSIPYTVRYKYDYKGNITEIEYPNGLKVTYLYDSYGCIINIINYLDQFKVTHIEHPITGEVYDIEARIPAITYEDNGFISSMYYTNNILTEYIPDNLFRVAQIKSSVMDYRYSYDIKGNITNFSKYDPLTNEKTYYRSYSYNFLGWIEKEYIKKDLWTYIGTAYDYDKTGNRIRKYPYFYQRIPEPVYSTTDNSSVSTDETIDLQSTDDITYGYNSNELNLLTSINLSPVTYDSWGNITSRADNGYIYQYNDSNQLVQVSANGTLLGSYNYNPAGKRYKKIENNTTTYYVYEGENLLYEKRDDGTEICYIYLGSLPIARVERYLGVETVYYYHTDHLGSTRVVTDSSGNVVATYDYDIFGYPEQSTNDESLAYTTKGQDATGLYYFNARYYDSTLGRFISEDPAKDGSNWWIYCANNPLRFVDKNGLWVDTFFDITGMVWDVVDIAMNPLNVYNWVALGADITCVILPGVTGGGKAIKLLDKTKDIALNIRKVDKIKDLYKFVDSGGYIFNSYKKLRKIIRKTGLEAYHLIEKRFANILGIKARDMLSIALTPAQHRVFTDRWRKEIGYIGDYSGYSKDDLLKAVRNVYEDTPELLQVVEEWLRKLD